MFLEGKQFTFIFAELRVISPSYIEAFILFIRFNTKNVTRGNKIRRNITRGNEIRGNVTLGNEIRGNVTRGNEIRGNVTRGNEIRENVTRGNVISGKRNSGKCNFEET
jgi:hypothetical protein